MVSKNIFKKTMDEYQPQEYEKQRTITFMIYEFGR